MKSVKYDSRDFDATNLKVIDCASEGKIILLKVGTELNPADLLTRPLDGETYRKHIYALGFTYYDESYAGQRMRSEPSDDGHFEKKVVMLRPTVMERRPQRTAMMCASKMNG